MEYHIPVLSSEVLNILNPQPGKIIVDATLGNAGHTLLLLKNGADVYGIDADPVNLEKSSDRISQTPYASHFHPILGNFNNLKEIQTLHKIPLFDGLLLDLGLSSTQLQADNRGFSFNDQSSLDMRINSTNDDDTTAEYIINTASFDDLYQIFTKYGQEKLSKPIILEIIHERQKSPIKSGKRLADIIRSIYDKKHIRSNIDPATKIFMALRIAVNNEFENLHSVLDQSLTVIKPQGVAAIISFHSGEDRIVKQFIRNHSDVLQNLTSKPITPSFTEIKTNPLSRSAVLRSYRIK